MASSKRNSDSESIDKWLEMLFLDPLTSFLDETAFRLDIFESANQFIIEVDIPEHSSKLTVCLKENTIMISIVCEGKLRTRQVDWPFDVRENKVVANVSDQVVEIIIEKETTLEPVDRQIEIDLKG
jgi:HSP20 family molecular chaperone IbpA